MDRSYRRAVERLGLSRRGAGLAALFYPLALMGVTLATGFREAGDLGEPATSVLGALLYLIAAPTTWVFAIDFIDVSRFTVLLVGAVTSVPLWYILGAGLSGGSRSWSTWLNRYLTVASAWTFVNLLLFGLLGVVAA